MVVGVLKAKSTGAVGDGSGVGVAATVAVDVTVGVTVGVKVGVAVTVSASVGVIVTFTWTELCSVCVNGKEGVNNPLFCKAAGAGILTGMDAVIGSVIGSVIGIVSGTVIGMVTSSEMTTEGATGGVSCPTVAGGGAARLCACSGGKS